MAVSCSESIDIMQRKSLSHYKEIFQVDAIECSWNRSRESARQRTREIACCDEIANFQLQDTQYQKKRQDQ